VSRRVLVTGVAGFIGSHLAERLVSEGNEVVGVDIFTDYYARALKEDNLSILRDFSSFSLKEIDLATAPLHDLLDGVDVVFHLAGQAGVRGSFGEGFNDYLRNNVRASQRLLEQADPETLSKFVYASSSSIYGDQPVYPTTEQAERRPVSPYGVTKAATEDVANVYHRTRGVPVVGLRYFTVYGPRQRPDMAFQRFLERALNREPLPVFGDGRQVRDFTYVADIVDGTVRAGDLGVPGSAYNIGGGHPVELRTVISHLSDLTGYRLQIDRRPAQPGEANRTSADCTLAARDLDFLARTTIADGLAAQVDWALQRRRMGPDSSAQQGLVA